MMKASKSARKPDKDDDDNTDGDSDRKMTPEEKHQLTSQNASNTQLSSTEMSTDHDDFDVDSLRNSHMDAIAPTPIITNHHKTASTDLNSAAEAASRGAAAAAAASCVPPPPPFQQEETEEPLQQRRRRSANYPETTLRSSQILQLTEISGEFTIASSACLSAGEEGGETNAIIDDIFLHQEREKLALGYGNDDWENSLASTSASPRSRKQKKSKSFSFLPLGKRRNSAFGRRLSARNQQRRRSSSARNVQPRQQQPLTSNNRILKNATAPAAATSGPPLTELSPASQFRAVTMVGAIRMHGRDYVSENTEKSDSEFFSLKSVGDNSTLTKTPIQAHLVVEEEVEAVANAAAEATAAVEAEKELLEARVQALEQQITETSRQVTEAALVPEELVVPIGMNMDEILEASRRSTQSYRTVQHANGGAGPGGDFWDNNSTNDMNDDKPFSSRHRWCLPISCCLVTGFVGIIVLLFIFILTGAETPTTIPTSTAPPVTTTTTSPPTLAPVSIPMATPTSDSESIMAMPTLHRIRQRGYILCRTESYERRQGVGFSLDLCHALSAAIFHGDANRTEFPAVSWGDKFGQIASGELDISTAQATYTMERDVLEPNSGKSFEFSSPYFYSGTLFAGLAEMVSCAEEAQLLLGNCPLLKVCVIEDSTTKQIVIDHLDGSAIVLSLDSDAMFASFVEGECNVLAGEPSLIFEQRARDVGYTGEYVFGTRFFSKDPLAMVTRGDDAQFADFCKWTLHALFAADAMNITQATAHEFPFSAASQLLNSLFGAGEFDEGENIFANVIAAVGNYGEMYQRHIQPRFPRQGMNLINTNDEGVLYANPFANLEVVQDIDRLPPSPVVNGTIQGIENRGVVRCGIIMERTTSDLEVELCKSLSVAMFLGNASRMELVEVSSAGDGFVALANQDIDVFLSAPYTMENDILEPTTQQGYTLSPPYYYEEGSADDNTAATTAVALCMATRQDDSQWSDFVKWSFFALIYTEELGLRPQDATQLPTVHLFGPRYAQMFRFVLLTLGNFGDLYNRTMPIDTRIGRNRLNTGGPILVPWISAFA